MLTHAQIWNGIDALARRLALSPSGLARLAGLDPTIFNKSKRVTGGGAKPRWPSTESIAKLLDASGVSFEDFAAMATGRRDVGRPTPLMPLPQAQKTGAFDESGFPTGVDWDEVAFPGEIGDGAYALEISGDALEPVYRDGDRLIVAPGLALRRGDRIVVKTVRGEVIVHELGRVTSRRIELVSINPLFEPRLLDVAEIDWIARILWASQ